jgi:hypothetical protein
MKLTIIFLAVALVGIGVFLVACKKRGPQGDAEAAVARGEYQFIALLDPQGNWTRPQVPGIPAWYFEYSGIRVRQTTAETKEADIAYMKDYNEALTQTLKAQGKFHVIEENVATVKTNLDNYEKSKQTK